MKPLHLLIIAFLVICSLSSCTGRNKSESAQQEASSIRDSVLIYKIEGLKAFIKETDYWCVQYAIMVQSDNHVGTDGVS